MKVDDDTQKALLLFNRRAEAAEAAKATERRLVKATKAKDKAAEALKRAQDGGGGSQVVSEAEAIWREAVDTWQRLRDGEEVPEQKATPPEGDSAEKAPTEETVTEATEEPTDEEHADEEDEPAAAPDESPADEPADEEHADEEDEPAAAPDESPADEPADEEDADEEEIGRAHV